MPKQSALPAPASSRSSRVFDKLKISLFSPSLGLERRNEGKSAKPIVTSTPPQSLIVPANTAVRPHSSYSGGSTLKTHDSSLLTAEDNATAVSTGNHSPPSSADTNECTYCSNTAETRGQDCSLDHDIFVFPNGYLSVLFIVFS